MNYKIFFILILVLWPSPLFGQKTHRVIRTVHPNTAHIARLQTKLMEKRMNLNPSQSEKVNSINSDYLNKLTDLQANTSLSQEEKLKQLGQMREAKIASLRQVLDENQFKEYLKLHKELQDQRSKRIKEQNAEDPDLSSEE